METVLIQLTSPKILKLLKELEELSLLRVINQKQSSNSALSEKYAGKLSLEVADNLQDHIENSRNEWNSSI